MKRRLVTHAMAAAWATQRPARRWPRRRRRRRERHREPAPPKRSCATPSRSPRPASIRRRSATSTRASVTAHIFESPLDYDYLARPVKLKPLAAEAMPEISDDFRPSPSASARASTSPTTRRSRARRASSSPQDYVYAFKRIYDPKLKSPSLPSLENAGHRRPARARAEAAQEAASSTTTARSKACGRSTATRCASSCASRGRAFSTPWPSRDVLGAVAREVVEAYGDQIMDAPGRHRAVPARPSGGAARRSCWSATRPTARTSTTPSRRRRRRGPGDRRSASRAGACRWSTGSRSRSSRRPSRAGSSFLNGEHDFLERLPTEFADQAMPERQARAEPAPSAASAWTASPRADVTLALFNMENPVVGGYTPEKVALRRAIALGYNIDEEIRRLRAARRSRRRRIVPPRTAGYDPTLPHRDRATTTRPARRRCSTCTATSTATATAGASSPTAARWCSSSPPSPTSARASSTSSGRRAWTRSASAWCCKTAQVAREPQGLARGQAHDVARRLVGRARPTATPSLELAYGPARSARATSRASSCRPSTSSTSSMKMLPDGPERAGPVRRERAAAWPPTCPTSSRSTASSPT